MVSVIAIDGPVASGKTAVGRALAHRLGFRSLDTGIMYRAITWLALKQGTPIDDEAALGALAERHQVILDGAEGDHVNIGGHPVGSELRSRPVNNQVSLVAKAPAVRRALVRQQRSLGAAGNIIMIGRDIGTVVLPDADLKVYLSASPDNRATRRWQELLGQGHTVEFQQVLQETKARDDVDSQREDSPLMPARDAFLLDTDDLGVDQVVERILEYIQTLSATVEA